ncbi:hypothetical protein [Marinobacterium sp. BA1]|uniref:hypothetical protein n=1 Tax=Marinobacterium sp. BA1 TaxID=3138931 RepID=UPI0032E56CD0
MRKELLRVGILFSCMLSPLGMAVSFDQVVKEQRSNQSVTAIEMLPAALTEHVMTTGTAPSNPVVVTNPLVQDGRILVVPMGTRLDGALASAFGSEYRSTRGYQCLGLRALDLPDPNTPTQAHVLTDETGLRMGEPYLHVIEFNAQDSADHAMSVIYEGQDLVSGEHFKRFMPVFLLMHEWYHTGTADLRDCKEETPLDMRFVSEVAADVFAAIMTGRVMETQAVPAGEIQTFIHDLVQWRTVAAKAACGHNALTHLSQPALMAIEQAWGADDAPLLDAAKGMQNTEKVAIDVARQLYTLVATDEAVLSREALTEMIDLLRMPGVHFDQQIGWLWKTHFSSRQSPLLVRLVHDYIADADGFVAMTDEDARQYIDQMARMRGGDNSPWSKTVTAPLERWMLMEPEALEGTFNSLAARIDLSGAIGGKGVSEFVASLRPVPAQ